MIVFRSRWGRTWARRIDVDAAVRMRSIADLDAMALAVDEALRARLAEPTRDSSATIADAFYAIFLPEIGGASARRFGRRLRSVSPAELRQWLFDEMAEFFRLPGPEPDQRPKAQRTITAELLWGDVYRLAGEAGVDPGPRTYGELAAIAHGRRRHDWAQTACLRADIQNSQPFRKGKPAMAADLDPTGGLRESGSHPQAMEITPGSIDVMGRVFGAVG